MEEATATTTTSCVVGAAVLETPHKTTTTSDVYLNKTIKKFRMVAFDLDGTLLNNNHQVSQTSVEYLQTLHSHGILIALATGRAAPTVYEHVLKLNLPCDVPVVCSNGANGILCKKQQENGETKKNHPLVVKPLFYTPVPRNVTVRTIELAQSLGLVVQYYCGDDIYANPSCDLHYELTQQYKDLTGSNTIYVKDDFQSLLMSDDNNTLSSKLIVMFECDRQDEMMDIFKQEFQGMMATIVRGSYGWFLEMLHKNVHKGNGMRQMCDELKIPLNQCIAFGDNDNDIEFLSMAGHGVAMKNGRQVVKDVADHVTDYTNQEDGVIRTLQYMEQEGYLELK